MVLRVLVVDASNFTLKEGELRHPGYVQGRRPWVRVAFVAMPERLIWIHRPGWSWLDGRAWGRCNGIRYRMPLRRAGALHRWGAG